MAIQGIVLKQARKSRGKSQAELAGLIGKDQTYISKIEQNKLDGGIKGDELLSIAKSLEYDPYVFSGELDLNDGDLRGRGQEQTLSALVRKVSELEMKVRPIEEIDPIAERVVNDTLLKRIVMRLLRHRSEFPRIMGYLDRLEEEVVGEPGTGQKGETAGQSA